MIFNSFFHSLLNLPSSPFLPIMVCYLYGSKTLLITGIKPTNLKAPCLQHYRCCNAAATVHTLPILTNQCGQSVLEPNFINRQQIQAANRVKMCSPARNEETGPSSKAILRIVWSLVCLHRHFIQIMSVCQPQLQVLQIFVLHKSGSAG